MSVHNSIHNTPHNSVHNTPHNSDDEADPNFAVTLISKLELSHHLHLHPNDSTTLTIVSIKLKGIENYNVWSCAMLLALEGRNKTSFIDNTCRRCTCHAAEDFKKHNQLMKLMQFLMGLDDSYMQLRSNILSRDHLPDAKGAYVLISSEESHRAVVTGLGVGSSQRTKSSVFNSSVNNRGATQRSQIFNNTSRRNNVPRPNNNGNRRTTGGPTLVCEHCGFNGHTIDRCFKLIGYPADFGKRNNTSNTNQNTQNFNRRFMNINNSVGSSSTSGLSDEQISKLLSLIKDNSLNDKEKGVQANMTSIIFNNKRFFNKIFKRFFNSNSNTMTALEQAGIIFDSGANHHLRYTDNNLVNVIDISYLRIKVSHPNGTEALITKVGNLVLTKFLTLYDVLVVPEYCVTLVSVHKVARDIKFIFGFDKSKCFLMSQNLMDVKIMGIDKQVGGLYYFDSIKSNLFKNNKVFSNSTKYDWHKRLGHPSDQVLSVFNDDIFFEKNNENVPCDICQRAKQTREPFPLSEHKSSVLGELVHLDIWGAL
ncbi:ribonuclease H-like domain-containing protein [Tanacetum coccineum]